MWRGSCAKRVVVESGREIPSRAGESEKKLNRIQGKVYSRLWFLLPPVLAWNTWKGRREKGRKGGKK